MKSWSELQELLSGIVENVYFQPPENLKIKYPCIIYARTNAFINYADNNSYHITKRYEITLITRTSDNDEYLDQLLKLPMCTFDREFVTDGLVHDVFSMYF